jgi:hypothetical protein
MLSIAGLITNVAVPEEDRGCPVVVVGVTGAGGVPTSPS